MNKKRLVFDLEFVGEDWESLDKITQKDLSKGLPDKKLEPEKYKKDFAELKDKLCFSPLTGKIITLGVYDADENKGAVYYDTGNKKVEDQEIDDIKYVSMTEAEMLTKFWGLAEITDEFISFFGRRSDVPYMNVRSAVHQIRPSKDLVSNRFNSSVQKGATHWDLFDILTYYGNAMYRGSLHRWCRAFNIPTPKTELDGSLVGEYYKKGKYLEIAKYNAQDLRSTSQLFHYWDQYLRDRI